ncbi:MAG: hypothetical protein A3K77_00715 [Euryarchaeota archaeon RBG_13_31_8]|nr:MAG: hypothetical protein A3K77_00715 [Euryarchaeota archaeon RBG_13_31_8]
MSKEPLFKKEQVIEALKQSGGFLTEAAKKLCCDYHTVQNYINRHEEIAKAWEHIKEAQLDFTESKLIKNIGRGKEASIFFYLKCKGKQRGFIEHSRLEIAGVKGAPPVNMQQNTINVDLKDLTDAELQLLDTIGLKISNSINNEGENKAQQEIADKKDDSATASNR